MRLADLFQTGAVLQRDRIVPLWGWAEPESLITGELDDTKVFCRSAADGFFMLYWPEHPAGGPYTLKISDGAETVVLEDILFGEVWLASGQSNMYYQLGSDSRTDKSDPDPVARQQEREFYRSLKNPFQCRFITVPMLASSCHESCFKGKWQSMTKEHAGNCSAVSAWFAHYLQQDLNIPIGVINSAWGGTVAEAWMSSTALAGNPHTRDLIHKYFISHQRPNNYRTADSCNLAIGLQERLRPDGENEGAKQRFHTPEFDDSSWRQMELPGSWIAQKIAGNGAVWVRKKVSIPPTWLGKELLFSAGTIDKQDITYFNGSEIGRTGSGASMTAWDILRVYTVPAALVNTTEVLLAIRAYSAAFDGNFSGKRILQCPELGESIEITGSWKIEVELDIGRVSPLYSADFYGPGFQNTPSILFDSMIRPLLPAAIAGVIWYQGESNALNVESSQNYYSILQSLINDWRYSFQSWEMPFIMVQLANYNKFAAYDAGSFWAPLRESQRLLAKNHPFTFMASAIDIGEAADIHPQDKKNVGSRLAAVALNNVYGQKNIVPGGPEIITAESFEDKVILTFDNVKTLTLKNDCEQSFYLSDDGENFTAAGKVTVSGNQVIIAEADAAQVRFVRYAWSDNPASTLYNEAGLPASSFSVEVKR